jgi:CRISPR-associated protein Csm5
MNNFLRGHRLAISTLSPVHIGCGQDFEPTNYVIDGDVLHHFDPSQAVLPEREMRRLSKLVNAAGRDDLVFELQRFFYENRAHFLPHARTRVPVAPALARHYVARVDRNARSRPSGLMMIERTSHNPYSDEAIVPGSTLKGAMRTAILDALNGGRPLAYAGEWSRAAEKRLLGGDFGIDPLRLLKVGDTLPQAGAMRKIVFCVNRKKRKVLLNGQEVTSKGVATRMEVLMHGQYRALHADATLHDLQDTGRRARIAVPVRQLEMHTIARDCNRYYEALLLRELAMLEARRFVSDDWADSMRQMLRGALRARLDAGQAFLLRVGRYGGAEAKTLEGLRSIQIVQAKLPAHRHVSSAHTVWLAADDEHARSSMLPYGWLLVEVDPEGEFAPLREALAHQRVAGSSPGRPHDDGVRAAAA